MKTPDLKPCPFCGGKAEVFIDATKYYKHFVSCLKCGMRTPCEHIEAIAVSIWNRRVMDENA